MVTWNYSVAARAVEYLAAGQTKVETFTIDVNDGRRQRAPHRQRHHHRHQRCAGGGGGRCHRGGDRSWSRRSATSPTRGTIAFTDVDLTDMHSISAVTPSAGALGTLTASVTHRHHGQRLWVAWSPGTTASRRRPWSTWRQDQTKVETFTITLNDGNGGTFHRTVSVTITGTNDAPVVAAAESPVR